MSDDERMTELIESVKQHGWDEQAARLQEQRAKLAAGEPIRCQCCLRMIESADEAT